MDVLFKEISRSVKCLQIIGGLDYEAVHRKINTEGNDMSTYVEDYNNYRCVDQIDSPLQAEEVV